MDEVLKFIVDDSRWVGERPKRFPLPGIILNRRSFLRPMYKYPEVIKSVAGFYLPDKYTLQSQEIVKQQYPESLESMYLDQQVSREISRHQQLMLGLDPVDMFEHDDSCDEETIYLSYQDDKGYCITIVSNRTMPLTVEICDDEGVVHRIEYPLGTDYHEPKTVGPIFIPGALAKELIQLGLNLEYNDEDDYPIKFGWSCIIVVPQGLSIKGSVYPKNHPVWSLLQ